MRNTTPHLRCSQRWLLVPTLLLAVAAAWPRALEAQSRRHANAPPRSTDLHIVVHEDQPYIVLSDHVDASWSTGAIALVSRTEPIVTTRAASRAIPAALAAWRRRDVTLYDEHGSRCTGRIGRLLVLNRVYPMSFAVQGWDGDSDADGVVDGARTSDADVARQAFALAPDASLLVGTIERPRGRCTGTTFALPANAPGPALLAADAAIGADLRARAVAYLRGTPHWQEVQRDYAAQAEAIRGRRWDEDPGTSTDVRSFRDASTGRHVLFAMFDATPEGCGDMFYGRVWVFLEVSGDSLAPVGEPGGEIGMSPTILLDVAHDGALTALTSSGLARMNAQGVFEYAIADEIPSLDCPC